MNNQLIEKVIKSNKESYTLPEDTFENPLLDRNVVKELSRSFVKILTASQQNSNLNNNLRLSVLANIRKICEVEPENHLKIDDSCTNLLSELYAQHVKELQSVEPSEAADRSLDVFLMRRLKELNLESNYQFTVSPEVVQALINLNENKVYLEMLFKDVIHWNVANKNMNVLKDLWTHPCLHDTLVKPDMLDNISLKMKSEIERILLDVCHNILVNIDVNINSIFSTNITIKDLVKKCSISADCFQICCGILNYVFIMTNFNPKMQLFVPTFVSNVKQHCIKTIAVLYPIHFSHIVVLLDFDIDGLPSKMKNKYIQATIGYLKNMHIQSECDLILLLSHYPQWFNIYFDQQQP